MRLAVISAADSVLIVEVPETYEEMLQGLAGRPSLADGRGMLFDMGATGLWPFSTRQMLFSLDLLMLRDDGAVLEIARDVPPRFDPAVGSSAYSWVLELPGGWSRRRRLMPGHFVRPCAPGWHSLRELRR